MKGTISYFPAGKVHAAAKVTLDAIDAERLESTTKCLDSCLTGRRFNWRKMRFEPITRTPDEALAYAKRRKAEWLGSAKTKFWRQYEHCERLLVFAAALDVDALIQMDMADFHFIAAHYPSNPIYLPVPAASPNHAPVHKPGDPDNDSTN